MDAEIRALEERFGMSPAARLRLGIRFGQAARTLEDLSRELDGPSVLKELRERARQRYRNLRVTGLDPRRAKRDVRQGGEMAQPLPKPPSGKHPADPKPVKITRRMVGR